MKRIQLRFYYKVFKNEIVKQIIVVDDYSKDGTREIITKKFGNKIDKIILLMKI